MSEVNDKTVFLSKWEDAPPWANFLTKDLEGNEFWHETEPRPGEENDTEEYCWISDGRSDYALCVYHYGWRDSIEKRPAKP